MKSHPDQSVSKLFSNTQRLWDDPQSASPSLGCFACVDRKICGGAHKDASFFDCADYCRCNDKATCDLVCRGNAAAFVARVREINGFDLMTVPRVTPVSIQTLPCMVPLIEHKSSRHEPLQFPIVALPLFDLIDLSRGKLKVHDRESLARLFGIDPNARIILSGVARDRKIERYWELPNRPALLRQIAALGVSLISPPNFSVLTDVPRTDNLHATKRILLAWVEMAQAGLPTALHVNARTEEDYSRWAVFIRERPEVQYLAFEFATGAGRGSRIDWHVAQLTKLALVVGRPLRLAIRGGSRVLERLREAFDWVILIDTDAFAKARSRKLFYFNETGRLQSRHYPTEPGAPIDWLLHQNVALLHSHHTHLEHLHAERRLILARGVSGTAKNGYAETVQRGHLGENGRTGGTVGARA